MLIDVKNLDYYFNNSTLKIKTDTGFENVIASVTKKEKTIIVYYEYNEELDFMEVAENHLFEIENGWVYSKDLKIGQEILSEKGIIEVLFIEETNEVKPVYDLTVDSEKHQYFLNEVSSHNTGKGSMLNALIHELDSDVKWINASQDNSVSTIRNEIVSFASTMSAQGKRKLLVLDEADNLTTSSQGSAGAQDILRGVIEQYAGNVRFFLTGNYKDRFIEPLLSRFIVFDFDIIFQEHKNEIAKKMYKRLIDICEIEGVEYDKKDIGEIVKKHYPSMRNMTISLQDNVVNGKLKLQNLDVDDIFTDLMEKVKEKNYSTTRGMVMLLNNPSNFYTWFWKKMDEFLPAQKQPGIVGELARYQEMDKIAKNKEITLMAFLLKLMSVY